MENKKIERKNLTLTDGRITLRTYKNHDAEELWRAISSSIKEMSPWLPFAHEGYTVRETKEWLKHLPDAWRLGISYSFATCDAISGEMIGGCGINNLNPENYYANLGYWVRSDRAGQGVAPAAARLLAKWGFNVLKLKRLEIVVAVENTRSLRAAEKAGAKREGVLRNRLILYDKPHDAVMHSLIPGDI